MNEKLVRFHEKKVIINGVLINLTNCEYLCLLFMLKNSGVILKKSQLIYATWGYVNNYEDNLVQLIHRLRIKFKDAGGDGEQLITSARGVGYIFDKNFTYDILFGENSVCYVNKKNTKPLSPDSNYSKYIREKKHAINISIEMG